VLAELHGKLDPERTDPVERSEDLLTDAVFGAIRHLPAAQVLRPLLERVGVRPSASDLQRADVRLWPSIPMPLWPGTIIEPDVIVLAGRHVVVFEAKLHSGFGRYPDRTAGSDLIHHQLAVQYAAVEHWAAGERLLPPVVVAVTTSPERPDSEFAMAAASLSALSPRASAADTLRWMSWRSIGEVLERSEGLRTHERRLADDVLALMDRRGVRRMFTGINPEDYWLVSAAQRVADERLYPQVQTFIADLVAVLAEDGITWSQPGNRYIWANSGTSTAKPQDWLRSFLGVHLWPAGLPERNLRDSFGKNTALYVLFDFWNPALEVGLSIACPGVTVAQQSWTAHVDAVVQDCRALPDDVEIVLDTGDPARPSMVSNSRVVDVTWFEKALASAGGKSHLRFRLRSDPLNLTVQDARERLLVIKDAVASAAGLWDMLRSTGHLQAGSSVAPGKVAD
jgi:hypothetical protein